MKFFFYIFFLSILLSLFSQQTQSIESIEKQYQKGTLSANNQLLIIEKNDTNDTIAGKNYYSAILEQNIQEKILKHSKNFDKYPKEFYGQLSAIQLITIDYINKEYDKALLKINAINTDKIPEALYWKAKIIQSLQRYDEAIQICQNFIRRHNNNYMLSQIWLILLESYYYKLDIKNFESYSSQFLKNYKEVDYHAYLKYLNGIMYQQSNITKAIEIFTEIITDFPYTQFRVQAEDKLYQLRNNKNLTDEIISTTSNTEHLFNNVIVDRYEDLTKEKYYIQFGVFSTENTARNYVKNLSSKKISAFYISKPVSDKRLHAVIQGPYNTISDAQLSQADLNQKNYQTFIFKAE